MKISSRLSSNYYRVYQKTKKINHGVYYEINHGLEFELELKNQLVKSFQKFLFDNQIEVFEHKLTLHFYQRSFNSIILNNSYTDWLVNRLKKIVEKQKFDYFLVTDYLENSNFNSFGEREYLFRLFQFLTFIRRFKGVKQYNGDQVYYFITFPVSDFLQFTSVPGVRRNRQYQLKKILKFLLSLQKLDPIVEIFSDTSFRSFVIFPYLAIVKKGKSWVGRISISEQLYFYRYPFQFTNYFKTWKSKSQLDVKIQIIQVISATSLKKQFRVEEFLNQFNISNSKQTQLKQIIITVLDQAINDRLIKAQFKILTRKLTKLTTQWITKSKVIYLYEIFNYKELFSNVI